MPSKPYPASLISAATSSGSMRVELPVQGARHPVDAEPLLHRAIARYRAAPGPAGTAEAPDSARPESRSGCAAA